MQQTQHTFVWNKPNPYYSRSLFWINLFRCTGMLDMVTRCMQSMLNRHTRASSSSLLLQQPLLAILMALTIYSSLARRHYHVVLHYSVNISQFVFLFRTKECVCLSCLEPIGTKKVYVCAKGKERKSEEEKGMRAKEPELPVALSKATSPRLDT